MVTAERPRIDTSAYPDKPMHVQPPVEMAKGVHIARQEGNLRWVFSVDPIFEPDKCRFRVFKRRVRPDGIREVSYRDMKRGEIARFLLFAHTEDDPNIPNYKEYSSLVSLADETYKNMFNPEPSQAVLTG